MVKKVRLIDGNFPFSADWCGGNVLLDLNSRKEVTYKSTNFPGPRTSPYACSWDVKVIF